MSHDWTTIKKEQLNEIKSLSPKDRLDMVEAMALMNQYIFDSCQGWTQWIHNPTVINCFNEKELKEIYEQFRKHALEFLEFYLKATKKLKPLPKDEGRPPSTAPYA